MVAHDGGFQRAAGGLRSTRTSISDANIVFLMLRSRVFAHGAYFRAAFTRAAARGWATNRQLGAELVLSVRDADNVFVTMAPAGLIRISESHAHDDGPHGSSLSVHRS
jgi:hypothetical protein